VRAEARRALEAMGPVILPVLRDHTSHDDPEVRVTLTELIKRFEASR
jgi:hypothetical protein